MRVIHEASGGNADHMVASFAAAAFRSSGDGSRVGSSRLNRPAMLFGGNACETPKAVKRPAVSRKKGRNRCDTVLPTRDSPNCSRTSCSRSLLPFPMFDPGDSPDGGILILAPIDNTHTCASSTRQLSRMIVANTSSSASTNKPGMIRALLAEVMAVNIIPVPPNSRMRCSTAAASVCMSLSSVMCFILTWGCFIFFGSVCNLIILRFESYPMGS